MTTEGDGHDIDQVREALRSREELYRSVVAVMADGVAVHDASGAIVECNAAAERILGLTRDQILGREPRDPRWRAVRPDGTPLPGDAHPAAVTLATGRPVTGVTMGVRTPDGGLRWIAASSVPMTGEDGPAVVATFTDVTARVRAEEDQRALKGLATLVASESEPRHVFDAIARHAASAVGAQAAGVVRFARSGTSATIVGAWVHRAPAPHLHTGPIPLDDTTTTGRVAATGLPARTGDAASGVRRSLLLPDAPVASAVATPVLVGGVLWGALTVATAAPRRLGDDTERRLAELAEIATLAIVSSDARAQLATLASTDHLTGLWNRRAFQERLAAELERARRHGRPVALVLFDLDHFKLVNDTHGHLAGDRVLVEVARRLLGIVRSGELVARVGGEEFAWILPETDGARALVAAERARREISGRLFAEVGRITVSAGACGLEDLGGGDDIFRLADVALYWAKAQGRDRAVRYCATTIEVLPAEEQQRRLERARSFAGVQTLARAVDAKDPTTQRHSERVAEMARRLAVAAGWSAAEAARLHQAGLVHDAGKIAVPDAVLLKAGRLTSGEYALVREHARIGAAMLEGSLAPDQVAWVRGHHERHDGSGYPDGIAGDAIPEGARLLALADAWDAMTVARIYGTPRAPAAALAECRRMSGRQFHPDAVAALEAVVATSPVAAAAAPDA